MIPPMDSSSISMIAAIVVLVTMSAYFSATETAFSSFNKIRMKSRADAGDKKAQLAMDLAPTSPTLSFSLRAHRRTGYGPDDPCSLGWSRGTTA